MNTAAMTMPPMNPPTDTRPPIMWSIAGTDSGGGAGLAADQRAADAFGVHLCPVVAAVTAQNSLSVDHTNALPVELIEQQLQALDADMPPRAIKTGLLGGPEQVALVARWVDKLRARGPLALVVDPVLGSSTGAPFANDATQRAYRELLLPRATLITPNRREAQRLTRAPTDANSDDLPQLARALQSQGAHSVCITGGDDPAQHGLVLDWLSSPHAQGWLALPRVDTRHHHGTGCTFASSAAAALALGFVTADAVVLAKMSTTHALRHSAAAGQGAGPVRAHEGFGLDPSLLPRLSWSEAPVFGPALPTPDLLLQGLYGIVDHAERLPALLASGVRIVQLRIKTPERPSEAWRHDLRAQIARAVALCQAAGATLFINDHWALARALGAHAVHLGQEDLHALGEAGRAALLASGLQLGISSHSLWELCRARTLAPCYIACGPVWPTLTKAMPWRPQGLHNLAWWRHMAGTPVVAIGGILAAEQVAQAAAVGADMVCVVRAIGDEPAQTVPRLTAALQIGRGLAPGFAPASTQGLPLPLPLPSLDAHHTALGASADPPPHQLPGAKTERAEGVGG
jgi:hydroxymethylpyrimidine kinase/phosphomethylpyrimidine kinase/thiamine-phosphate diphosphorylase